MENKKDIKSIFFLLIVLLIVTFIFFTKVHPIIILDVDDWFYINFYRDALPLWGNWNPTRVLPETLAPLISTIATKTIMPFTGKFIESLAIMNALIVTIFMGGYLYCFIKLIRTKLKLNTFNTSLITIIFYLMHFLIFRIHPSNNLYMFYAADAICYYYYVIPSLLSSALVMYFIADDTFKKQNSIIKTSILMLLIYCVIFSNAFQSIILVIYVASTLIKPFIELVRNKEKITKFIKRNIFPIIILLLWLISQLFEMNGGRASSLVNKQPFIDRLIYTATLLIKSLTRFNHLFMLILLGAIVVGLYFLFKDKLYKKYILTKMTFSLLFITFYLVLLCTSSIPEYIERVDATYGIFFYLLLFIIITISYFIKKYPKTTIVLPLFIYIMFFQINTPFKTFKESNTLNLSPEECIEIDNILINQIKTHVDSGDESMTLYIPKFNTNDNWPIALYGIDRIPNALYKHGIIKYNIKVDEYQFSNELYSHLKISN